MPEEPTVKPILERYIKGRLNNFSVTFSSKKGDSATKRIERKKLFEFVTNPDQYRTIRIEDLQSPTDALDTQRFKTTANSKDRGIVSNLATIYQLLQVKPELFLDHTYGTDQWEKPSLYDITPEDWHRGFQFLQGFGVIQKERRLQGRPKISQKPKLAVQRRSGS